MKRTLFSVCMLLCITACNDSDDLPSNLPLKHNSAKELSSLNNKLNESFSKLFHSPDNLNFLSLIDKKKRTIQ